MAVFATIVMKRQYLFWVKNDIFFAKFFQRKCSRNHNIGPRSSGGHTYVANNDSAFTLAYAVIMLNVDQVPIIAKLLMLFTSLVVVLCRLS
jgi:hypothetical protein